jgi:elongation factor Ts
MAAISAEMVKALREKSGLPMMECKSALVDAGGDEAKALEILKEKSKGKLAKLAGRATGEGRIYIHADGDRVAMVEVRCETEPVANTDDFLKLVQTVAICTARAQSPSVATIRDEKTDAGQKLGDFFDEIVGRIRENIQIANVVQFTGKVGRYVHFDNKKGALAEFTADCPAELAAGVCMHIVALNPPCLSREQADPAEVARMEAIYREEAAGKPANIADNIVKGKLGRWYSEFVLPEQPFVKDDKQSVGQALKAANPALAIKRFVRFEVGGEPRTGG